MHLPLGKWFSIAGGEWGGDVLLYQLVIFPPVLGDSRWVYFHRQGAQVVDAVWQCHPGVFCHWQVGKHVPWRLHSILHHYRIPLHFWVDQSGRDTSQPFRRWRWRLWLQLPHWQKFAGMWKSGSLWKYLLDFMSTPNCGTHPFLIIIDMQKGASPQGGLGLGPRCGADRLGQHQSPDIPSADACKACFGGEF